MAEPRVAFPVEWSHSDQSAVVHLVPHPEAARLGALLASGELLPYAAGLLLSRAKLGLNGINSCRKRE